MGDRLRGRAGGCCCSGDVDGYDDSLWSGVVRVVLCCAGKTEILGYSRGYFETCSFADPASSALSGAGSRAFS